MLGLKEHVFVANPRDSIMSLPEYQSSNKMGASFETPCGRLLVKISLPYQNASLVITLFGNGEVIWIFHLTI